MIDNLTPVTSWAEYADKLSTQVAGGNSPDIINIAIEGVRLAAAKQLLMPLNDFIDKDPDAAAFLAKIPKPLVDGLSVAVSLFSDAFRTRHFNGAERWSSYAMVGPTPFGPFRIHGTGQIIPPDYSLQPYANQVVFWQGQAYLLGTVWNDEQDFICDPIPLDFSETSVKIRETPT